MKSKILVLAALFACSAFAQTPSMRLGRLRSCDTVIVKPAGKDQYTLYGKPKVRELLAHFRIESAVVRGPQGGKELFKLSFFEGINQKPTDVIWVRNGGLWGLNRTRQPYGASDTVIGWLEKAKG